MPPKLGMPTNGGIHRIHHVGKNVKLKHQKMKLHQHKDKLKNVFFMFDLKINKFFPKKDLRITFQIDKVKYVLYSN